MRSACRRGAWAAACVLLAACGLFEDDDAVAIDERTGELADGATWSIQSPEDWNGTLLVYSHGMATAGQPNPAQHASDPTTATALLDEGYALAGTSYATTGWAVEDALRDQVALLDVVAEELGEPERTIAWGSSLGGLVTVALVEQSPDRFDGGVALCGVVAGGVALWDSYLDVLFALDVLVGPVAGLELIDIRDPAASLAAIQGAISAAQQTAPGRARVALAATLGDIPTWVDLTTERPADDDLEARQAAQYEHLANYTRFGIENRADVEARAGGNPSTNVGVDYAALLDEAGGRDLVTGLYEAAGLDLDADLARLAGAPRIAADPAARAYVAEFFTPTGALEVPLLDVHHTADFVAVVESEQAYGATVEAADASDQLRQVYVERPAHCLFAPAEAVAAIQTLVERLDDDEWPDTDPDAMNDRGADVVDAEADDATSVEPAFIDYEPGPFPRPHEP